MRDIKLNTIQWDELRGHLLQTDTGEQAAFAFISDDTTIPQHIVLVPPEGYRYRSEFGFELTDDFRAAMIKEAHDRGARMIEFHSHPFSRRARFSPTDIGGLRDFVPHVRWRLRGRPYAAFVMGPFDFDSLFWIDGKDPEPIGIAVGTDLFLPTGDSIEDWIDAKP